MPRYLLGYSQASAPDGPGARRALLRSESDSDAETGLGPGRESSL